MTPNVQTPYIALTPTTSAANSSPFQISNFNEQLTIQITGLAGTETAKLQMWDFINSTWVAYLLNGSQPQCDVNNNVITVGDCVQFRVAKSATAAAVGVVVMVISDK